MEAVLTWLVGLKLEKNVVGHFQLGRKHGGRVLIPKNTFGSVNAKTTSLHGETTLGASLVLKRGWVGLLLTSLGPRQS
jgi:hypothetical protein